MINFKVLACVICVCECLTGDAFPGDRYIEQPDLLSLLKANEYSLSVKVLEGEGKRNLLPNYLSGDLKLKAVSAWDGGLIFESEAIYYFPFSSSPLPEVSVLRDAKSLAEVVRLLAGSDDRKNVEFFEKKNQINEIRDYSERPFAVGIRSAHLYKKSLATVYCLMRYEFKNILPKNSLELLNFPVHDITVTVHISGDLSR